MDPPPILSIIHTITIGTILNFNVGSNGHGLKMLCVNRPLGFVFTYCPCHHFLHHLKLSSLQSYGVVYT